MSAGRLLALISLPAAAAAALIVGRGHGHAPAVSAGTPIVIAAPSTPAPSARSPKPPAGPLEVSRAFVTAYAAFIYGRLSAAQLPGLSRPLRRQVRARRPAPAPAVVAAADPRLRTLRVSEPGPDIARAAAMITDGAAVYQLALTLRRGPGGWTITGLSETS